MYDADDVPWARTVRVTSGGVVSISDWEQSHRAR